MGHICHVRSGLTSVGTSRGHVGPLRIDELTTLAFASVPSLAYGCSVKYAR